MSTFFLELRIWKRQDAATAILYRCFKNLVTGRFAVQSADFFKLPIDANQLRNSEMQFVELFIDTAPSERCDWFDTAEEAIAAHDCDFS